MAGYEDILSVDYDPSEPTLKWVELVNAYYQNSKFYAQAAGACYAVKVDSETAKVYDCTFTATAADAEITWAEAERATNTMALHLAAGDPHAQYTTAAELASAISAHAGAADPHTVYALDADLTAHAGAADPHTGYQKESEKAQANGYASLDAGGSVPLAQLANNAALPTLTQIVYDSGVTLNALASAANSAPVQAGRFLFTTHVVRVDTPGGLTVLKIVPPTGWKIGALSANAEANSTVRAAAIDSGLPTTGKIQWNSTGATNNWLYASVTYVKD